MPVLVDRGPSGCTIRMADEWARVGAPIRRHPAGAEWIEVGLVNNMPEAALAATERQFLDLLGAAAGDSWVHLRFFALPSVPRGERGRSYVSQFCSELGDVREAELDGLIVTGTEPNAASLPDEPYWNAFTELVDWAGDHTISTVWSCLASHAAVLHLDGVARVPLAEKCSGVFHCERILDHPLTAGVPATMRVPHSRWNTLDEAALRAKGYAVLTRSPVVGVDTFARQDRSLFLFFQGHPECDARTLLNEFRRDVGRYLRGERERFPGLPVGYFDAPTEAALEAFRERACAGRSEALMAELPEPQLAAQAGHDGALNGTTSWHPFAVAIYRNWLTHLSAEKRRRMRPTEYVAALRLENASVPAG
jgi:homoserine O-succinyltransferase/O-acetyltransferase